MDVLTENKSLILKQRELHHIQDLACTLVKDALGPIHPNILLFKALFIYLRQNGIEPGFVVHDHEVGGE